MAENSNIDIYELALHETIKIHAGYWVTRVPGGWLYENEGEGITPTFVPFNNEFQKQEVNF